MQKEYILPYIYKQPGYVHCTKRSLRKLLPYASKHTKFRCYTRMDTDTSDISDEVDKYDFPIENIEFIKVDFKNLDYPITVFVDTQIPYKDYLCYKLSTGVVVSDNDDLIKNIYDVKIHDADNVFNVCCITTYERMQPFFAMGFRSILIITKDFPPDEEYDMHFPIISWHKSYINENVKAYVFDGKHVNRIIAFSTIKQLHNFIVKTYFYHDKSFFMNLNSPETHLSRINLFETNEENYIQKVLNAFSRHLGKELTSDEFKFIGNGKYNAIFDVSSVLPNQVLRVNINDEFGFDKEHIAIIIKEKPVCFHKVYVCKDSFILEEKCRKPVYGEKPSHEVCHNLVLDLLSFFYKHRNFLFLDIRSKNIMKNTQGQFVFTNIDFNNFQQVEIDTMISDDSIEKFYGKQELSFNIPLKAVILRHLGFRVWESTLSVLTLLMWDEAEYRERVMFDEVFFEKVCDRVCRLYRIQRREGGSDEK